MSQPPNDDGPSEIASIPSNSNHIKRTSGRLANLATPGTLSEFTMAAVAGPSSSSYTPNLSLKASELINEDSSQRRRSSSRSIKRRKFDDELVDSTSTTYPKYGKFDERLPHTLEMFTTPPVLSTPAAVQVQDQISLPAQFNLKPIVKPVRVETPLTMPKKKSRKNDKNVGVNNHWKPIDDLTLIFNVCQTNDLEKVYRDVKFSSKFTHADIEHRWRSLFYKQSPKTLASAAMRQLHSDVVSEIQLNGLFSEAEEKLLKGISSKTPATLETFNKLLQDNAGVFGYNRTGLKLMKHWHLLRYSQLLSDQTLNPQTHETVINFSEMQSIVRKETETGLNLGTIIPNPVTSELIHYEVMQNIRKNLLEIRMLEDEIPKYQALMDSLTGIAPSDFDSQTYAVLRGRQVRYLMRSHMITIGRSTKDFIVDVDLELEGPSFKISRLQAVISLQPTGEFILRNTGRKVVYVDAKPMFTDDSQRINHNSLLEFGSLRFIFLINTDLTINMRNDNLN